MGGGKMGHEMQNLILSARVCTKMVLYNNKTDIPVLYCLSHNKYLKF